MNIYLLNIPIVIVGVSIVLMPLLHKMKNHHVAANDPRPTRTTMDTHDEDRADRYDYVG